MIPVLECHLNLLIEIHKVFQCVFQFLLLYFPDLSVFIPLLHPPPTITLSCLTLSPPQFMSFLTLVVDIRLWVLR